MLALWLLALAFLLVHSKCPDGTVTSDYSLVAMSSIGSGTIMDANVLEFQLTRSNCRYQCLPYARWVNTLFANVQRCSSCLRDDGRYQSWRKGSCNRTMGIV